MNAPLPDDAFAREESIFNAAVQFTAPAEQAAFLNEMCRQEPALRARVEKLLAAESRAASILHQPAANSALVHAVAAATIRSPSPLPLRPAATDDPPGTGIGPYQLLEKIGEGGCGVVYLAAQEQPVRRQVALKIIKPGMDSRQVIARFAAERQALALMDHPNIAKFFDAGDTGEGQGGRALTEACRLPRTNGDTPERSASDSALPTPPSALGSSRPYFVMELVRGTRLTDYCNRKTSPPRTVCTSSSRSATPSNTPTKRASSTAISSRRTSW